VDVVYAIADNRRILIAVHHAVCKMVSAKAVYASVDMEHTQTVAEESAVLNVHFPAEMEMVEENVSLIVLDNVNVQMEVLCQIVFLQLFLQILNVHFPAEMHMVEENVSLIVLEHVIVKMEVLCQIVLNPPTPNPPPPPPPPPPPVEKSKVARCRKMW